MTSVHLLDVTVDETQAYGSDVPDASGLHDALGALYRSGYARMVRFAAARLGDVESTD